MDSLKIDFPESIALCHSRIFSLEYIYILLLYRTQEGFILLTDA